MKNTLLLSLTLIFSQYLHAQDSTYRKYYAAAAARLNVTPNMLPVGLEGGLKYGLSQKIYVGVNAGMDRATRKAPIAFGGVAYGMPPGAKARLLFYNVGLDVQYKLPIHENSLVVSCANGIEIIKNGYVTKNPGQVNGGYSVLRSNSLFFIRPGVRYYLRDGIGLGVQYNFLAGNAQFGEAGDFQRLQLVMGLKTSQKRRKHVITM